MRRVPPVGCGCAQEHIQECGCAQVHERGKAPVLGVGSWLSENASPPPPRPHTAASGAHAVAWMQAIPDARTFCRTPSTRPAVTPPFIAPHLHAHASATPPSIARPMLLMPSYPALHQPPHVVMPVRQQVQSLVSISAPAVQHRAR
eukprot:356825-Chlamydomonas_euryale.AAC.1